MCHEQSLSRCEPNDKPLVSVSRHPPMKMLAEATEPQFPFDWILADVLKKGGPHEFVMSDAAYCPNCFSSDHGEDAREAAGGIEVNPR